MQGWASAQKGGGGGGRGLEMRSGTSNPRPLLMVLPETREQGRAGQGRKASPERAGDDRGRENGMDTPRFLGCIVEVVRFRQERVRTSSGGQHKWLPGRGEDGIRERKKQWGREGGGGRVWVKE